MRTKWAGKLEGTGFILYALIFGFFGFTLMFTSLPIENSFLRLALLVTFYFVIAIPIGYFDHRFWPIAGFVAWNPIAVGILGLMWSFENRSFGEYLMIIMVFAVPLAVSLGGGWFGAKLWRYRHAGDVVEEAEEDKREASGHFPGILR